MNENTDQRLHELTQELNSIDNDLKSDKHYINDILFKKKKDFFNGWAELIEEKYILENTPDKIKSISNQIRLKLISTGHESAISNMYEQLATKYKSHKQNPTDEEEQTDQPIPKSELQNSSTINQINLYYKFILDRLIDFSRMCFVSQPQLINNTL